MRNLQKDRKQYWHLNWNPKIGSKDTMIEMESYWEDKGLLYELQSRYEVELKPNPIAHTKKRNLKYYNHDFLGVMEQSEELDAKEEAWSETHQDWILQQTK